MGWPALEVGPPKDLPGNRRQLSNASGNKLHKFLAPALFHWSNNSLEMGPHKDLPPQLPPGLTGKHFI